MSHNQLYTLLILIVLFVAFQFYIYNHKTKEDHTHLNKNEPDYKEAVRIIPRANHLIGKNQKQFFLGKPKGVQKSFEDSQQNLYSKSISIEFKGRLGNIIFEYASLLGIAYRNNLTAVLPWNSHLRRYFDMKTKILNSPFVKKYSKKYIEKKGCTFEPEVLQLGSRDDVLLDGFFQSWKYFHLNEKELRENLFWKSSLKEEANSQFEQLIAAERHLTYVGVHVRRGDMTHNMEYVKYGYISAGMNYITKAMNYFRDKFNDVLFIVVSDELKWCKNNIRGHDVRFVQEGNQPEIDMAILTECNHTIMTTGSFGWWSAWLTGGEVTYYKNYPRPRSKLAALFNGTDYWPPSWIPM